METKELVKEDLSNLEAIFAYARKLVSDNEQELIKVINFRILLFEKLNNLLPKEESKDLTKVE